MRPPREVVLKKLLKRVAFPILNRYLRATGTHLYHYSPDADRLHAISDFGSEEYKILRTGRLPADGWWACARTIPRGGSILDVGANTGYTAAWFATLADRVYAFEPHPGNRNLIAEQLRIRRITNVEVRPTAIGDRNGEVDLYCKPRAGLHSLGDVGTRLSTGVIRVPCTTLDDLLRAESIRDVRLLKIDVEGFEPEVLYGARRALESGAIPRIIFEYSPAFYVERGMEARAPADFLSDLGFDLFFTDWRPFAADDLPHGPDSQCDVVALAPGANWQAGDPP